MSNEHDAVNKRVRELLMAQLTKLIGDDKHKFTGATVGVKFSDGNASFSGTGQHDQLLELIDAHTLDVSVSLMERLAMSDQTDTREFVECLTRVEGVLAFGRVPQQAVIGRLISAAENTKGKLSIASLDAAGVAALGCGDPDCDNCGGDGSKLSESSDTPQEAQPPNKRVLH